jgi:hypothetical protein
MALSSQAPWGDRFFSARELLLGDSVLLMLFVPGREVVFRDEAGAGP